MNKEDLIEQYQEKCVKVETFANTLIDKFKANENLSPDQSRWLIEFLLLERGLI